jgi:predicted phage tail protein
MKSEIDLSVEFHKPVAIEGAGGKGGGGGGKEAPDSLRSNSSGKLQHILSEGPCGGIEGGLEGVHYNETPLMVGSQKNFKGVLMYENFGRGDQASMPGFDAVTNVVQVQQAVTQASGGYAVAFTDAQVTAVKVTISTSSFFEADDKGNVNGSSVTFAIDLSLGGGAFNQVATGTITGKTRTKYERDIRIPIDSPGQVSVRLRRVTADSSSLKIENTISFERYTRVIEHRLNYPFLATAGHIFDAKQFGNRIPQVQYRFKGRKVKVFSNMDGAARTFSGNWDGTFKVAEEWTTCPVLIFRDLVLNKRYGLGKHVPESLLDGPTLYQLSQFCAELVPDGSGGQEHRFSTNVVLNRRSEAFNLLQQLTAAFRSMLFWMDAKLWLLSDQDRDPVKVVTNANVIGGKFTYAGESNKQRYSVVNVSYTRDDDYFRKGVEVVEDRELIKELGWKPTDLGTLGVSSRGQARRLGLYLLNDQEREGELVTYQASFDHLQVAAGDGPSGVAPGSRILIADKERGNALVQGRATGVSGSDITLDRDTGETGTGNGTLYMETDEGVMESVACTYTGSVVTATEAFTGTPASGNLFILVTGVSVAEEFTVVNVTEKDKNTIEVVAKKFDSTKWARIDNDTPTVGPDIMQRPSPEYVEAPTAFDAQINWVTHTDHLEKKLDIDWTDSTDELLDNYMVLYQHNNGNWKVLEASTSTSNIILEKAETGTYNFQIYAVNSAGRQSLPLEGSIVVPAVPPTVDNAVGTVSNLALDEGGTEFTGHSAKFNWNVNSPTGVAIQDEIGGTQNTGAIDPNFRDCLVTVKRTDDTVLRTESVVGNHYVYTSEKNTEDNFELDASAPVRNFKVEVQYRDKFNRVSTAEVITVSNPAPAAPTLSTETVPRGVMLTATSPTDLDWAGARVWTKDTASINPASDPYTDYGRVNAFFIPVNPGATKYFRVAFFDEFGKTTGELNVSAEGSASVPLVGNTDIGAGVIAIDRLVQTAQDRINAIPNIESDISTLQSDLGTAQSDLDAAERLLDATNWGAIVANMEPIHPDLQWSGGTELSAVLTSGGSRATESTVNGDLQLVTNATGSQYLYLDNLVANGLPAEVAGDLSYADARYLVLEFTPTVDAGNDFTTHLRAAFRTNSADSANWFDPVTGTSNDQLVVGRRYTVVWDLFGKTATSGQVWGSAAPDRIWFEWQDGNAIGNTAIIHKVALMSSGDVMTAYSRARITDNETLTADHASRINTLEASDGTNTSAISSLQSVQSDHATRINNIETTQGTYGSRITTVENTTASQATAITNLETTSAWVAGGTIPPGHGHVGMTGDLTFEANMLTTGANDGEIKVTGTYYEHPTAGRRSTSAAFDINTPYEGNTSGFQTRAYLICSNVACPTRFSGWDGVSSNGAEHFFLAVYYESSGSWTAFGNTTSHPYTPLDSDVVVAVLTKPNTASGGIDTLTSLVTQTGNLDGRVGSAESSITILNTTTGNQATAISNLETAVGTPSGGDLFSRIATVETTSVGNASRLSLVEVGQYEQYRTGLSMNAVDQRIVMDDYAIVDIVAMEDNVTVYQNGSVLTTLTNRGDVYSLSVGNQTKGDILTSDKPTAMYDRGGYPLPHLGFKGRQFIAKQTRAANIELNIYSEEDAFALIYVRNNTNSEAHPNPARVPTPTADLSAGLSGGAVTTITLDAATYGFVDGDNVSVYIQASTDVVVMCRDGDSADDHSIVPPVSRRVLNARANEFNTFDSVATWTTNSSSATANGDIYYFYDSDVPGSTFEAGDGSGTANAHGLPYEALGDTYIIPANTALEVTVVAVEPCIVDVTNVGNTIQQSLDFTAASFTNPVAISIEEQTTGTYPWSGQAVTLKSRDGTPFGVRIDDNDADEMWLLGYRESLQQNFVGGRVGVVEKVTKDNASRLTTVETTAGNNSSAISTLQTTTGNNATAISAIQTSIGTDDAQGNLFSRIATVESTSAANASRITTTEIQINGALPLLPQGGNLAQDASHWYMPTTNDSSGTFTGADLDAHANMTAATVGTATAGSDTGTGLQGYDGRWMFTRYAIPVDTSRRYRMRVKVLFPTGVGGNFYAGLATLDGSYNAITGGAGTHRYFVGSFSQSSNAGTIATFEGEITGEGDLATQFRAGTQYVRPMIITSYNTTATPQPIVLSIDFDDVTEEVNLGSRTAIVEEALWDGSETRARIMFLADAGTGAVAAGWLTSSANPNGVVQSEVGWAADKFLVYNSQTTNNDPVFAIDTQANKVRILGDLIADGSIEGTSIKAGSIVQVGTGDLISGTSIYDRASMAGHNNGDYRFWAGGLSGAGANFSVDREGAITARKITILSEDGTTVWFDSVNGFSAVAIAQINANTATRVSSVVGTPANNTTHTDFSLTDDPASTNVRMNASVNTTGMSLTQTWLWGNSEPSEIFPSSLTIVIKYRDKDVGGAYTTGVTKTLTKITSGTPTSNQFRVTITTQAPYYEPDLELGGQPINIPGWKTETITDPSALVAEFTQSLAGDSDGRTWEVLVELTPTGGDLAFDTKTRTLTVDTTDGGKPFVILDNGAVPGDGNADTLDGFNSSDFGRLASAQTWTQENTFNAKAYFGDGIIVSGPGSYSSTNDTRTDVGIVLPSGAAIHGDSGTGYLRYLFEWNNNDKIVIGQTGTSLITGVSLQGGSAGGVDMYHAGIKQWETITNGFQFGDVSTRTSITSSGGGFILNHADNSDLHFRTQGNDRLIYDHSANYWQIANNGGLRFSTNSSRVKVSLYSTTSTYGIGMQSGMTYGHLNDWAMTFCFNNESDRGFWWGHESHLNSEGAMSLTTDGQLWLHNTLTVSGAWNSTSNLTVAKFRPSNYAVGNPELNIKKAGTANQWNIELWDGSSQGGVINFGSTSLQHQGNEIATQSWVNSQIGGSATLAGTNTWTGSNTFDAGILIGNLGTGIDHRFVSYNDGGAGTLIMAWSNSDWSNSFRLTASIAQVYAGNQAYNFSSSAFDLNNKNVVDVNRLQVGNGAGDVHANYWTYVYGRENQNEDAHKYGIYTRLDIEGEVSNFTQDRTRAAIYGYALLEDNSTTADTHVSSPVGVYGYALGSKGHADTMYGVYGFANNNGGADTDVNTIYGGYFESRVDNAGSTAGTLYGIRAVTRLTNEVDGSVVANAVHGLLNVDGGTMSTARMLYGTADVEVGATVTTLYGLHLDMQNRMDGTVTNRRGIWLEGNTTYLTNSIGGRTYFGNAEGYVNPDSPYVAHFENEANVLVTLIQGPSDGSGVYTRYSRGTAYSWDVGFDSTSDFLFRPNGTSTAMKFDYDMLPISFNTVGLVMDGKQALSGTDSWLRLNSGGQFTSGIYCASSQVRTDNEFRVRGLGATYFRGHELTIQSDSGVLNRIRVRGQGTGYTTANVLLEDDSGSTVRGMGMFMYNRASGKEWYFGQPYNGDETYSGVYYSYQSNGSEGAETSDVSNYIVEFHNNGQVRFQNGTSSLPSIAFHDNPDCGFRLSSNEIIVGSDGNNVMGWKPGRIEVYNNSIIDFNSHTGSRTMMELEGRAIMNQMSDRGALLLRSADDSLNLYAGDSHANMTDNVGLTGEDIHMGAEGQFELYTNLQNGWANRESLTFSAAGVLTSSGTVVQQSDQRLKHSIRDWDFDVSAIIDGIRPRRYGWNNAFKSQDDFGLIAQELQEVFPSAVQEDEDGTLSVDYSRLSVVAIAAIKEERTRVQKLEDKVAELAEVVAKLVEAA